MSHGCVFTNMNWLGWGLLIVQPDKIWDRERNYYVYSMCLLEWQSPLRFLKSYGSPAKTASVHYASATAIKHRIQLQSKVENSNFSMWLHCKKITLVGKSLFLMETIYVTTCLSGPNNGNEVFYVLNILKVIEYRA